MCIFMGGHTAWFSKLGPSPELGCSGIKSMTVWVWACALLNIFTLDSGEVLVIFFHPYLCFGSSFATGLIFSKW